jgi:DNA-binding transcriptional regulator GbsR (MarR family)
MPVRAGVKTRPSKSPPAAGARKEVVPSSEELNQARDLGIDTCGRIAEFWGFTRTMGRAFGLLYLSEEPLTQLEIQKRLGISAGSASMTLTGLIRWGVAHKVWVRGQRREHYRAETDFWKMISGVLNERERREIGAALDLVSKAESRARSARRNAPATVRASVDFTLQRLERLHELYKMGEVMLDMLLGHLKLDVGRFRAVMKA